MSTLRYRVYRDGELVEDTLNNVKSMMFDRDGYMIVDYIDELGDFHTRNIPVSVLVGFVLQ